MSAQRIPDLIRRYSVLIALFWLVLAVLTNVFVPQLETVAESHNVSLSLQDSPSLQASKRIGAVFDEFDSDSSAMIVLEGDQPLGADAHHYYDGLVQKPRQTPATSSTFRTSGATRSRPPDRRVRMAKRRWSSFTWRATRASRWPTSPLMPCAPS